MSIIDSIKNFFTPKQKVQPVSQDRVNPFAKPSFSFTNSVNDKLSGKIPSIPAPTTSTLSSDFFNTKAAPKIDVQKKVANYGAQVQKNIENAPPEIQFIKSIVQAIPRAAGTIAKTAGVNTDNLNKGQLGEATFGSEPIKSIQEKTKTTQEDIKKYTGKDIGAGFAGTLAVGGTLLDLIPGIGGEKKGVTASLEAIAKSNKAEDIVSHITDIFKTAKVTKTPEEIASLANKYKDITDTKVIADDLKNVVMNPSEQTLYHGSKIKGFKNFDSKFHPVDDAPAFFFTPDRQDALRYASQRVPGPGETWGNYGGGGDVVHAGIDTNKFYTATNKEWGNGLDWNKLKSDGYTGVKIEPPLDSADSFTKSSFGDKPTYAVFDTNNIKIKGVQDFSSALNNEPLSSIGTPAPELPQPGPSTQGEKVFNEFASKIKEGPAKKTLLERAKELPGDFTRKVVSRFSPLSKYEKEIMGAEKPNIPLGKKFEQVAGASGKGEAGVRQLESDVIAPIKNNYDDFNTYLALKRSEDRLLTDPELRKVGSYTLDDIKQALGHMETKLGPELANKFTESASKYQALMDDMLKTQVDSGRISKAAYDAIKQENKFYAPFAVMKYVDERGSLGGSNIATTEQIIKAIKGIQDDTFELKDLLQTSAEKIYKANILAEKNKAMLALADVAKLDKESKFFKIVPLGSKPKAGNSVVSFFENGVEKMIELPEDVAKSINGMSASEADIASSVLNAAYKPMRLGATGANLAFSLVNLLTDSMSTALISKYGINSVKDMVKFPLQFLDSLATSFAGNFKVSGGKFLEEYNDFLKSGAANSTFSEALRPESFKTTVGAKRSYNVLDNVAKFSNAMEETGKILGLKRGKEFEKLALMNPAERSAALERIVTEVRNYGGSPDFAKRGDAAKGLNLMIPFFNARLQGATRDISRLFGKDGAKEAGKAWFRLSAGVGLPTAGLMAVNLSDENFDDYMQINPTERANYWMIPKTTYFTDSQGNKVRDYYRFPKRGVMQPFANTIENMIMFAKTKNPDAFKTTAGQLISYISPINLEGKDGSERLQSVVGSLNPLIKIPAEVGSNKNFFFKSDIVPRSLQNVDARYQYNKSTPEIYKKIGDILNVSPLKLQHTATGFTGGFTNQFAIGKPEEGRSQLTELPVFKKFNRSTQLNTEDFQSEIDKALSEQATKGLITKRKAQDLHEQLSKLPKDEANAITRKLLQTDPETFKKLKEISKQEKLGLSYQDKQIASLNVKNGERAKFIHKQALKLKTREEKNAYIEDLRKKKVITPEVFVQLKKLTAAKAQ